MTIGGNCLLMATVLQHDKIPQSGTLRGRRRRFIIEKMSMRCVAMRAGSHVIRTCWHKLSNTQSFDSGRNNSVSYIKSKHYRVILRAVVDPIGV